MTELSEKYQTYAFEQLGETPELIRTKLDELKNRLKEVPDSPLNSSDLTDKNLIRFLRGRKLHIENALNTVLSWGKFRLEHPDWFNGLNSKEFERFSSLYRVMDEPDELGRLVCIFPAKRCLEIFTPEFLQENPLAIIRGHMWFVDRISHDYRAQVCGVVAILSFKDLTMWDQLSLAQILSVNEVISLVHYLQDCIGLRLKSVSFFDEPQFVQYIWYFIKPLLTEAMSQRFGFYGTNYDKLYEILPSYSGGGLESSPYNWVQHQIELDELNNHSEEPFTNESNSHV